MKQILAAALLTIAKITFLPDSQLLVWLMFAISTDLITGVIKAYSLNQARTSKRFRETITKFGQYLVAIIGSFILMNIAHINH